MIFPLPTYLTIEAVADTTILGKSCRVLQLNKTPGCIHIPATAQAPHKAFVYEEDSVAYVFHPGLGNFQILYDLTKRVGESWRYPVPGNNDYNPPDTLIRTVTRSYTTIINGVARKTLDVTDRLRTSYVQHDATIIERIGDIHYLFYFMTQYTAVCDGRFSEGLRCYDDKNFGHYETGIVPYCTYSVDIETTRVTPEVEIYPNPTSDLVTLTVNGNAPLVAALTTITGQKVAEQAMTSRVEFSLATLPQGVYLIVLNQENRTIGSYKVVKQ